MYDLQYYKAKTVDDAAAKINQAKDGKYIASDTISAEALYTMNITL